jgi:hypothetical protein
VYGFISVFAFEAGTAHQPTGRKWRLLKSESYKKSLVGDLRAESEPDGKCKMDAHPLVLDGLFDQCVWVPPLAASRPMKHC